MAHASARSAGIRSHARWAATVMLVSATIGGTPGVALATTPGSQVWVQRYNGSANASDAATAMAVSPDGSTVFVTGKSRELGRRFDYATVAYETSTGAQLWRRRYNGAANM